MTYQKLARKHDPDTVSKISKIKFYEFETSVGTIITVCLLIGDRMSVIARGVSICSILDNYRKKEGKNRSLGRAMKAIHNAESGLPLRPHNRIDLDAFVAKTIKVDKNRWRTSRYPKYSSLYEAADSFKFKSEFLPELTEYEKQLLIDRK